jgi:hypothetical protein
MLARPFSKDATFAGKGSNIWFENKRADSRHLTHLLMVVSAVESDTDVERGGSAVYLQLMF